jgi:DNA (cytosine-5)-methyltransferase 1/putative restriction endonuclease
MDEAVWLGAHQDWEAFIKEAEGLLDEHGLDLLDPEETRQTPDGRETDRETSVLARLGQGFFRSTVLGSYRSTCSVCSLDEPRILVASHIKPWSEDRANRLNPRNGICLCSLHDRVFDEGMLVLDGGMNWTCLKPLRERLASTPYEEFFGRYEGKPMYMPDRWRPDPALVEWHREESRRKWKAG